MDHLLIGTDIRLTYLQDRRALSAIDWPTVLDDLTDAGAMPPRFLWCDLDALTHVVLATERGTGRHVGIFGLVRLAGSLKADCVVTPPGSAGPALSQAMLAYLLARIVRLDGKPEAVVSRRGNIASEQAVRLLGAAMAGIAMHPPASGNVITLRTAHLARQTGPGTVVMDLRGVPQTALLRDLRRLHRVRVEVPRVRAKAARTGGATRRPRTATRTGKTA